MKKNRRVKQKTGRNMFDFVVDMYKATLIFIIAGAFSLILIEVANRILDAK